MNSVKRPARLCVSCRKPGAEMRVFGVVGTSGSGKTTLLELLIAELAGRGLRVNAIKHSHHDLELEPPQKDSARFRAAGAAEVMVVSPYRYAILHELRSEPEPDLHMQLARLSPAEITLIEGFRFQNYPKLEVWRAANGKSPRFIEADTGIIAVASDDAIAPSHALPQFALDDIERIADFILAHTLSINLA